MNEPFGSKGIVPSLNGLTPLHLALRFNKQTIPEIYFVDGWTGRSSSVFKTLVMFDIK